VRAQVDAEMARGSASPLDGLRALALGDALTRAARTGASAFLAIIDELRELRDAPIASAFERLLERTRYLESLGDEEDADDRRANVQELGAAAAGFDAGRRGGLSDFLAEAALVSDVDSMSDAGDRVLMLTAHNAKGLEFPLVIVTGLEEGLMPHASALDDAAELEEERRLFYVALTRAQDQVVLTAAAYRRRHDQPRGGAVSRFVDEIPAFLLEREGFGPGARSRPGHAAGAARFRSGGESREYEEREADAGFAPSFAAPNPRHGALGREVFHESFGRGVVVAAEGHGPESKFTVRFGTRIRKVLGRFLTGGSDVD
jgi:ATP-dependent DNA helicase UvrD/PcrA